MQLRTTLVWAATVCLGLAGSGYARAEAPSTAAAEAIASDAEVDAWFQRAHERFTAGDYAAALRLFERACARAPFDGCALNLGAVHHALRHCGEAQRHYGEYLAGNPEPEPAAQARAALRELELHCREAAASPPEPPITPESNVSGEAAPLPARALPAAAADERQPPTLATHTAPVSLAAPAVAPALDSPLPGPTASSAALPPSGAAESASTYNVLGISALLAAGAVGVTCLYSGIQLANANADVERHKATPYDAAQAARLERSKRYQALTWGSGVASGVLLGAGSVLWWLGARASLAAAAPANVTLTARGVRVSGTF